jgi:hypothetical protein
MRGIRSLPRRLERMEQRQTGGDREGEIQMLAAEYGLHPDEVRHEFDAVSRRMATYGREPVALTVRRLAQEFALDEAELWAEYTRIQRQLGSR